MANDKPKFSAGLVTAIITLVFIALFGFFYLKGAEGIGQQTILLESK